MRHLVMPLILLMSVTALTSAEADPKSVPSAEQLKQMLQADLEAAKQGDISAAANMILAKRWDDMLHLEPQSPPLLAWIGHTEPVSGMTGVQIHGVVLANWAVRLKDVDGEQIDRHMLKARDQIAGSPLVQPVVMTELAWLFSADRFPLASIDLAKAVELQARALKLYQRQGQFAEAAECRTWLASLALDARNPAADRSLAFTHYAAAEQDFRKAGNIASAVIMLFEQAECMRPDKNPAGDWGKALKLLRKAEAESIELKDPSMTATAKYRQGLFLRPNYNPDGNWEDATACFASSAELFGKLKKWDSQGIALYWQAIGNQPDMTTLGDWKHAIALHRRSAEAYGKSGLRPDQATVIRHIAWCQLPHINPAGDYALSIETLEEALAISVEAKDLHGEASALDDIVKLHDEEDNPHADIAAAIRLLARLTRIYGELGDRGKQGEMMAYHAKARAYLNGDQFDAAGRLMLKNAATLLRQGGREKDAAEVEKNLE